MSGSAPEQNAGEHEMRQSRHVTFVYCAMALGAACASIGLREWGSAMGMLEDTAQAVSNGFAALALFNLIALSAIEVLYRFLRRHAG